MPWEETNNYNRSGHGNVDKYDDDSMRTIEIDSDEGIKAIIACAKGKFKKGKCQIGTEIISYLFEQNKGWTISKTKKWFDNHEKKLY